MQFGKLTAISCLLATLGSSDVVQAQTLLRWKLEPGQAFVVECRQETTTQVAFSGKSADTKIDLDLALLWTVGSVNDQGAAIKQSIRRLQFKLDSPKAGVVQYDSAAKTRPTGQARTIADAAEPLLKAEVEITMTARGEIVAAKPANAAAEKLFAEKPVGEEPGVFSKQAIQALLRHPLAVLPERPVADGESWTSVSSLDSAAGKFEQTTTYRLAGIEMRDGETLAKIDLSAVLASQAAAPQVAAPPAPASPPGGPGKLTLKSHEQSGHILFSVEQGRLVSSEQNQQLTTERPYRETTITVTLSSKQTTTLKAQ